jgi:hypothetical protein
MVELKFNKPIEIFVDNDFRGKKYKFPYKIIYVTTGPELNEEFE